jgi:thiosulfate dehydrogenase [quinone] large subunit
MQYQKVLRVLLGLTFLWPFFDKVFGLGFATVSGKAWIDGVSPTTGFLSNATYGPFSGIFQSLAGSPVVDWLFMLGLLLTGLALILGIGMRIACVSGITILGLIYLSAFPPKHNPLIDEHIIYSVLLLSFLASPEKPSKIASWWRSLPFVKKYPVLE